MIRLITCAVLLLLASPASAGPDQRGCWVCLLVPPDPIVCSPNVPEGGLWGNHDCEVKCRIHCSCRAWGRSCGVTRPPIDPDVDDTVSVPLVHPLAPSIGEPGRGQLLELVGTSASNVAETGGLAVTLGTSRGMIADAGKLLLAFDSTATMNSAGVITIAIESRPHDVNHEPMFKRAEIVLYDHGASGRLTIDYSDEASATTAW